MSYENAPATELVASHCAACGRALVDATSVETGMGPVCRERYGYHTDVPDAARIEANAIVYALAAEPRTDETAERLARLRSLGFDTLAARVEKRLSRWLAKRAKRTESAPVNVDHSRHQFWTGGALIAVLAVRTPYDPAFVAALKSEIDWRARQWDQAARLWIVAETERAALWRILRRHFAGADLSVDGANLGPIPDGDPRRPAQAYLYAV